MSRPISATLAQRHGGGRRAPDQNRPPICPADIDSFGFRLLLGIIGVLVPLGALVYAVMLKTANPQKYEVLGRFINQGA